MPNVPDNLKDDAGRRQALKLVAAAAARLDKAQQEHRTAIRFASDVGLSLRDIADAAGVSHQTVKNILADGIPPDNTMDRISRQRHE